ncbi:MAG: nucleotide exchange factor GrpE [Gammaproteobacteria bacterium]|nr:nucleotide exchange factor GrpE [Gammaproteobacteria bacterium]MBK81212.1 nucleotide exchange factor GrpE [Gammaproteobacteria bacterium]|tara:strand:- start:8976 stop:9548 length:573 start_codon:yes stop_codon:yes gene_type:complete
MAEDNESGPETRAADASQGDGGAPQGEADRSPEALAGQVSRLEEQLEQFRDQALRAQAEAENTRRRAARDVENAHKFALEKFAGDLLPVLDSLEKAVEVAAGSEAAASIAEGVELSLKLFLSVLEKHGVERIDPAGAPFDPQVHEAMAMVPSEHAEPNSVLEVMQAGYLLNGRVVRAAKVVVARAPDGAS